MKNWSEEELELVKLWTEQGWTAREIANELDRSEKSVVHKRGKLGIKLKTQYSKQELINILRNSPSTNAEYFMSRQDLPSVNTYQRHFGSWNEAVKAAGLVPNTACLKMEVPTTLYVVKFPEFYKVGITQTTLDKRFANKQYPEFEILFKQTYSLDLARSIEKWCLNYVKEYAYTPPNFGGSTECFKMSEFEFDTFLDKLYNRIFNSAETN